MQVKSIREHSAILLTFNKLPFTIKIFVLFIFEWPIKFYSIENCQIRDKPGILAIFCRGIPSDYSAKSFSILTVGFREEDVLSFLYRCIKETGQAPWQVCFSTDQISFSYFCRRSSSDQFCQNIVDSDEWIQKRRFLKVLLLCHKPRPPGSHVF